MSDERDGSTAAPARGGGDERDHAWRSGGLEAENEALRRELVERRLEVLRLRDRLIGAEEELGTALGHNASLAAELASYRGIPELYQQTIQSTTWKLMWRILTPYRKVRERLGGR